jgi:hypothetical protein
MGPKDLKGLSVHREDPVDPEGPRDKRVAAVYLERKVIRVQKETKETPDLKETKEIKETRVHKDRKGPKDLWDRKG